MHTNIIYFKDSRENRTQFVNKVVQNVLPEKFYTNY